MNMLVLNKKTTYKSPPSSPTLEIQSNLSFEDDCASQISASGLISATTSLDNYMFLPFDHEYDTSNPQLPSPLSPVLNQSEFFNISSIEKEESRFEEDVFNFLMVDDNKINLTIMEKILNRSFPKCCNLKSTTNPLEILDLLLSTELEEIPYDVLFLDIEMPELNGVEVAGKIRSIHKRFDQLSIIAVTSCYSPSDLQKYSQVGIDFTIPKPITLDPISFRRTVLEVMSKRR